MKYLLAFSLAVSAAFGAQYPTPLTVDKVTGAIIGTAPSPANFKLQLGVPDVGVANIFTHTGNRFTHGLEVDTLAGGDSDFTILGTGNIGITTIGNFEAFNLAYFAINVPNAAGGISLGTVGTFVLTAKQIYTGVEPDSTRGVAYMRFGSPADLNLAASTPQLGVQFDGDPRQWATGALNLQIEHFMEGNKIAFVGASTATDPINWDFADPRAGVNATIVRPWSARFEHVWIRNDLRIDGTAQVPSHSRTFVTKTANYSVTTADDTIYVNAASGNVTLTLPTPATTASGGFSYCYRIKRIDTSGNTVAIVVSGGTNIDASATLNLGAYASVDLQSNGTQYFRH